MNIGKKQVLNSESLSLLVLAVCLVYFFLWTTMFECVWPSYISDKIMAMLILADAFRLATLKEINFRKGFAISIIIGVCFYAWRINGYNDVIYFALLVILLIDVPAEKVLKVYLTLQSICMTITIACALTGKISNLAYTQAGHSRIRYALGIGYPTDFSAHVLYILLAYGYLRRKKINAFDILLILISGSLTYYFTDARTNFFILLLYVFSLIITALGNKGKMNFTIKKLYKKCCVLAVLVSDIVIMCVSYFYDDTNRIMILVNKVLNSRPQFGRMAFDNYPITRWGQYIYMVGNGGSTEKKDFYFFIDCSYVSILLRFGIVIFIVILCAFFYLFAKAYISTNIELLTILTLVSVQCCIEHHMIEITYNIFVFLVLADWSSRCKNSMIQDHAEEGLLENHKG